MVTWAGTGVVNVGAQILAVQGRRACFDAMEEG